MELLAGVLGFGSVTGSHRREARPAEAWARELARRTCVGLRRTEHWSTQCGGSMDFGYLPLSSDKATWPTCR
eukprot:881517-Rhodomonas_salina.1